MAVFYRSSIIKMGVRKNLCTKDGERDLLCVVGSGIAVLTIVSTHVFTVITRGGLWVKDGVAANLWLAYGWQDRADLLEAKGLFVPSLPIRQGMWAHHRACSTICKGVFTVERTSETNLVLFHFCSIADQQHTLWMSLELFMLSLITLRRDCAQLHWLTVEVFVLVDEEINSLRREIW